MAVPGQVTSGSSVGCHQMLRTGEATLVTRTDEVLEEVGRIGADLADPVRAPANWRDRLDEVSQAVVEAMPAVDWVPVSALYSAVPFPAERVTTAVDGLVGAGRLERDADGCDSPPVPGPIRCPDLSGPPSDDGKKSHSSP